ncbi:MAG: FHA domain-containing protein, partial [Ktedonobacteraceae bacterium]|nr:FHA domain-containing protein [Ktedonobacteraceae bacterium]
MSQNYGVLRIVGVRPPVGVAEAQEGGYSSNWLPEDHLVYLLRQKETSIGRALNNDVILIDPTVSREHARLVLDEHGWRVVNRTERSVVRVNGNVVPAGGSMPLRSQDYVLMGYTTLQFLAPENANGQESPLDEL